MKVHFLAPCIVLGVAYAPSEVRVLDKTIAEGLIAAGYAEPAADKPATQDGPGIVAEPERRVLAPQKVAARK